MVDSKGRVYIAGFGSQNIFRIDPPFGPPPPAPKGAKKPVPKQEETPEVWVTNDELRRQFIDTTVPQGQYLGVTFPDVDLRFDEKTGHWQIGAIDWDEFWAVVKGNGPLNRERLAHKVQAWDEGAWVREAAAAYAAKHALADSA